LLDVTNKMLKLIKIEAGYCEMVDDRVSLAGLTDNFLRGFLHGWIAAAGRNPD